MSESVNNIRTNIYINPKDAGKNLRSLHNEARKLNNELSGMAPNTEEFRAKARRLQEVQGTMRNIRNEVRGTTSAWEKQRSSLSSIGNLLKGGLVAGGFAALFSTLKQGFMAIVGVRQEFEKYEAILTNTFQSQKRARQEMQMIKDIASQTPFSVEELTDSFVKMVNRGFVPTRQEIIKLGDLAAAVGKDFDQLVEAMLDAQTGEFERLKEFGIKAKKEGDRVKFTFKGVTEEVQFTDEAIQNYILSLGDLTGVSGSMAAISETLGGKISNLGDSWDAFLNSLGESSIFKETIELIKDAVDYLNDWIETKPSDEMEKEREALVLLNSQLLDNNTKSETRKEILKKLKAEYPDYFGHLDDEKSKVEDISKAIEELNDQMLDRIVLQQQEEKIQEALEDEKAQMEDLAKSRRKLALVTKEVADENGIALKAGLDPLKQAERVFNQIPTSFSDAFGKVGELGRAIEDYKGEQKVLGAFEKIREEAQATKEELKNMLNLSAPDPFSTTDGNEDGNVDPQGTGGPSEDWLKAQEKAREKITEFLQKEGEKRLLDSLSVMEREIQAEELKYQKLIDLAKQYGLDTTELEKELSLAKQAIRAEQEKEAWEAELERINSLGDQATKAEEEQKKGLELAKEFRLDYNQLMFEYYRSDYKNFAEFEKAKRMEMEETARSRMETAGMILNSIQMISGALPGFVGLQKAAAVAQTTFDTYKAAQSVFAHYAEKSPVLGFVAATAAVVAGLARVAKIQQTKFEPQGSFYTGGFTGLGTGVVDESGRRVAGVVHDNEYVVATEELMRPDVAGMVQAIEQIRQTRMGGSFATGGPTSANQTTIQQQIDVDPLNRLVQVLERIEKNGVYAIANDRFTRDIKENIDRNERIKNLNKIG